jgi:hypothetical protein
MVDETGQPYAYAGDDPVDYADSLGLCTTKTFGYLYAGPCANTGAEAIAAEQGIQATSILSNGEGFSLTKGFDAVGHAADTIYHNYGTASELGAAVACVALSAGFCAIAVAAASAAELSQEHGNGDLNSTNVAGVILLGATDVLSSGITGLVEKIGSGASEGFAESILYRGVSYTLRVLSVSPSVVIALSKSSQAGASTTKLCG